MQFNGIANPFGTDVFEIPTSTQTPTYYYKGVRLNTKPVARRIRAPKPLSATVANFLLTF